MIDTSKECELVDLVEAAVIADLQLDNAIAPWLPREHDAPGMKGGDDVDHSEIPERPLTIAITAEDRGDFKGAPGSGIKLVGLAIEIERNVGEDVGSDAPGDGAKDLRRIASRISDRLPATQEADKSRHAAFSNPRLKVYGIMADETERRTDVDLARVRVITRELICVQVA